MGQTIYFCILQRSWGQFGALYIDWLCSFVLWRLCIDCSDKVLQSHVKVSSSQLYCYFLLKHGKFCNPGKLKNIFYQICDSKYYKAICDNLNNLFSPTCKTKFRHRVNLVPHLHGSGLYVLFSADLCVCWIKASKMLKFILYFKSLNTLLKYNFFF